MRISCPNSHQKTKDHLACREQGSHAQSESHTGYLKGGTAKVKQEYEADISIIARNMEQRKKIQIRPNSNANPEGEAPLP